MIRLSPLPSSAFARTDLVPARRRATTWVAPTVACLLGVLCFVASPARAQSVADYYHTAAQHYIGGENPQAEAAAEAGLALDPANAKLRALLEKIRERNEGTGSQHEQDDADEQQPGEGEQQSGTDSEGEQDGGQQPGEQQPPEDEPPQDEGEAGAESDEPPDDPQGGGGTATPAEVQPGQMSRDEAERILRALQTDELELLRDVQRRRARPRYVEKDW